MSRADQESVEYDFPVSSEQERLLVLDRMHPDSVQYHVPTAFRVFGRFEPDVFAAAFEALVDRHESLRTVFRAEGSRYRQVVVEGSAGGFRTVRDVPVGDLADALLADARRPFDLARGPLLRCTVFALADGSHAVLLVAHHIVCDGWSAEIVLRELAEGYAARLAGRPDDRPPLPIQYPDYAAWQSDRVAAGDYDEAVTYWRDVLAGAPATFALPTDRPRPAVQSTAADAARFAIPAAVRRRLLALGAAHSTTPFVVLFAAYLVFLGRICQQRDLVVGMPTAGRDRTEVQDMVGMLTNTVAVRVAVPETATFAEVVRRVADQMRAGQQYADAPFSAVVDALAPRRQLSYDPLVQVAFAYDDDTELRLDLPDARTEWIELPLDAAKFDLLMYVERRGADLAVRLIHRTDLLDVSTVRRWADSFRTLLAGLLDHPDRPVTAPDLLDERERQRVLGDWNRTEVATPETLVPDLVAAQAADRPDAVAVVCGDTVLTYRELIERADAIARRLRAAGVGPEVPVGVCLPRSAEMAVAALAVLRAGGAYLPLDPEHPATRLAALLADARAPLVLTAEHRTDLGVPVGVVAAGATEVALPAMDLGAGGTPGPGNLAYLLFTSGSTGRPKAVAVEHRALTNLATAVREHFGVTAADRVLQYVSFGFDVAASDLAFTWVAGAELHIATEAERLGDALFDRLRDSRISYVFLPPTAAMSLPCPPGALPDLRLLAVGGEACPAELVERWAVDRRVLDAYGPSESTVYGSTAVLEAGRPVRIGRPVPNIRAYLLDARLRPVPVGVTGEIYLAGAGLARGYAHRPGLTAERFVADPYGPAGARMYRTGDLGRYDDDGVLSYLGRGDSQVKVRGFRVELGEIETVLAGHPQVRAAAATVLGDTLDRRLAAYVVPVPGAAPSGATLRSWLAERLPGYLVPDTVVPLAELPVGRSGKVDRSALPEPAAARPELAQRYVAPDGATQRRLAEIWMRVLGLSRVGVDDSFFDLGGNSIRLLAVLAALREQAGSDGLSLVDLFRYPTIAALSEHLESTVSLSAQPIPAHDEPDPVLSPVVDGDRADTASEAARRGQDRRARLAARTARADTGAPSTEGSSSVEGSSA